MTTVAITGCTSEPEPEPGPGQVDLECDIPQLFEDHCGGSICHGVGESTAAGLDLTSPGVEARVTGVAGKQCAGVLADPADPDGSLLYTKLTEAPDCGARMPLNGEPLSADEQTCVRDWISGLLPPMSGGEDTSEGCAECACEPDAIQDCFSGPDSSLGVGICVGGEQVCAPDGLSWGTCAGEISPRGEDCFTVDIDENCDGMMPECSDLWSLSFGDGQGQAMRSIVSDSNGDIYSAGDFEGLISFGGEPLDADIKADLVIAKHDRYGNPLWSKRYGDSSNQYSAKLIIDAQDNIVLIGRIYGNVDFGGGEHKSKGSGDIILAKFDRDGNYIWSRRYGGVDPERAERIVADSAGDIILTGTFTGAVDFGSGPFTSAGLRDAFVLKLDGATGAHLFSVQIGGSGDDYGFGIDTDAQDNILIAGRFQESIEIGNDNLSSAGDSDIYLAKLSSGGVAQWSTSFGGSGEDGVHDLAISPQTGDIVMVGHMSETVNFGGADLVSAGSRDLFVVDLNADGSHVWSANYGDEFDQFENGGEINSWITLAIDPGGKIFFGGSLAGSLDFGGVTLSASGGEKPDIFYVKLDADGSYLAGNRYGGIGSDDGYDLSLTSSGHILMAGRTFGSKINFGVSGTVTTSSSSEAGFSSDGYIVKLAN